jgi:ribosomal protein L40E
MGEFVTIFFIFIAATCVTLVLFGGWLIVMTAKGVGYFARMLLGETSQQMIPRQSCPGCRQINPASARFCRRCGQTLPGYARTR